MDKDLLFWLLPGVVFSQFLNKVIPKRNQSGWDYIARIGLWSFLIFITAEASYDFARYFISDKSVTLVKAHFALNHSLRTLPLAIIYALGLGVAFRYIPFVRAWYWRFSNLDHSDPYVSMARDARNENGSYILLAMKNGKIYVGRLVGATLDPNESTKPGPA